MAKTQKTTQKKKSSGKKLIKKPTTKSLGDSGIYLASTLIGLLAASGVSGAVPTDYEMPAQAGMVAVGVAGNASFNASTVPGKILKGVSQGIALKGSYDLLTGVLQDGMTADPNAKGVTKFYQDAIGLGCPGCDGGYAQLPYDSRLGNPFLIETVYDEETDVYSIENKSTISTRLS